MRGPTVTPRSRPDAPRSKPRGSADPFAPRAEAAGFGVGAGRAFAPRCPAAFDRCAVAPSQTEVAPGHYRMRFTPDAVGNAEPSQTYRSRTSQVSPRGLQADVAGEPPIRADPMMWKEL